MLLVQISLSKSHHWQARAGSRGHGILAVEELNLPMAGNITHRQSAVLCSLIDSGEIILP